MNFIPLSRLLRARIFPADQCRIIIKLFLTRTKIVVIKRVSLIGLDIKSEYCNRDLEQQESIRIAAIKGYVYDILVRLII